MMMFSSIVGVNGSAQFAHCSTLAVTESACQSPNLVESCSDMDLTMVRCRFSSYGDASIERFSLREQSRPQHRYPSFCLIAVEVPCEFPFEIPLAESVV